MVCEFLQVLKGALDLLECKLLARAILIRLYPCPCPCPCPCPLVSVTVSVTRIVTLIVTIIVTIVVPLASSSRCRLRASPLTLLRITGFARFFGYDGVVKTSIAALHKPAERHLTDLLPALHIAAETRQVGEQAVIIRQARGGDLMPRLAPQNDSGLELLAGCNGREVAINESHDIERHEREIAKVEVRRDERLAKKRDVGRTPVAFSGERAHCASPLPELEAMMSPRRQ
jgi:hypothetical protein